MSLYEGPKCLDEGPKCLFQKGSKCPTGAEVVGAELVGAEVSKIRVFDPSNIIEIHIINLKPIEQKCVGVTLDIYLFTCTFTIKHLVLGYIKSLNNEEPLFYVGNINLTNVNDNCNLKSYISI